MSQTLIITWKWQNKFVNVREKIRLSEHSLSYSVAVTETGKILIDKWRIVKTNILSSYDFERSVRYLIGPNISKDKEGREFVIGYMAAYDIF